MRSASASMRMACLALVSNPPGALVAAFCADAEPAAATASMANATANLIRISRRKQCTVLTRRIVMVRPGPPPPALAATIERSTQKSNPPALRPLICNDFCTSIASLGHPGERRRRGRLVSERPDAEAGQRVTTGLRRSDLDGGDAAEQRPGPFGIVLASERACLNEVSACPGALKWNTGATGARP